MAQFWWLGAHLAAWRAVTAVAQGGDAGAREATSLLRRCNHKLLLCRRHGLRVHQEEEEEVVTKGAAAVKAAEREKGQLSLEDVFDAQGIASGDGYDLGTGARVPPRRAGRRRQPPASRTLGGRSRAQAHAERANNEGDWSRRWFTRERLREARADAEAERELERDTTTPALDRVEEQLRADIEGGKRPRSGTQDVEEPPRTRARILPLISSEERARAQGEKRKRAVSLSGPLPTEAARASALRAAAVDGRSRRRSGV